MHILHELHTDALALERCYKRTIRCEREDHQSFSYSNDSRSRVQSCGRIGIDISDMRALWQELVGGTIVAHMSFLLLAPPSLLRAFHGYVAVDDAESEDVMGSC